MSNILAGTVINSMMSYFTLLCVLLLSDFVQTDVPHKKRGCKRLKTQLHEKDKQLNDKQRELDKKDKQLNNIKQALDEKTKQLDNTLQELEEISRNLNRRTKKLRRAQNQLEHCIKTGGISFRNSFLRAFLCITMDSSC